jgi:putative acetyltransferase
MADRTDVVVRALRPEDLDEMLDVWVAAWQAAYREIDFVARREWARGHIAELERTGSCSLIATCANRIVGAMVVDPATGYLDQIVVATELQGRGIAAALLAQARRIAPAGLELHVNQDNARAIRFYEKHGFVTVGKDVNSRSGAPTFRMRWEPSNRQVP